MAADIFTVSDGFIKRIQALIKHNKTTQENLAIAAKIDKGTISRWKSKEKPTPPSFESVMKISEAWACSFNWLAYGEGSMLPPKDPIKNAVTNITKQKGVNTQEPDKDYQKNIYQKQRDSFKQLAAQNFDVIFEFIADEYGNDSAGIEDFKDDFKMRFSEYRTWREKKRTA